MIWPGHLLDSFQPSLPVIQTTSTETETSTSETETSTTESETTSFTETTVVPSCTIGARFFVNSDADPAYNAGTDVPMVGRQLNLYFTDYVADPANGFPGPDASVLYGTNVTDNDGYFAFASTDLQAMGRELLFFSPDTPDDWLSNATEGIYGRITPAGFGDCTATNDYPLSGSGQSAITLTTTASKTTTTSATASTTALVPTCTVEAQFFWGLLTSLDC